MQSFLITGARRSGTELLYHLLDGHPDVMNALTEVCLLEYVSEFSDISRQAFIDYFFSTEIDDLVSVMEERALLPVYRETILASNSGVMNSDEYSIPWPDSEIKDKLTSVRSDYPQSFRGIWDLWFETISEPVFLKKYERVVIKNPDYGLSGVAGVRLLPDCKILGIVRNPLLALSSLRRIHARQPNRPDLSTARLLSEVNRYVAMWDRFQSLTETAPDSFRLIKFEDLVLNTREQMQEIADFLGIRFHEILVTPTFFSLPWRGDSSVAPLDTVSQAPLERSRVDNLSSDELQMAITCLAPIMNYFGYQ